MDYELKEDYRSSYGIIKYVYYKVINYDGNEEKLKEYVKKLNDDSCFNIEYRIKSIENNEVIIKETIDTLD